MSTGEDIMRQQTDGLFTVTEAAARLKVSKKTVLRWIEGGKLRGFKLGGGRLWRIKEAALESFLRAPGKHPGKSL